MRSLLLFAVWMSLFQISCHGAPPLVLVHEGRATATIVVAEDAPAIDRKAASVLQDYIQRMSQIELPISFIKDDSRPAAIYIGLAASEYEGKDDIRNDGFSLRVSENRLFIQGGRDKGVLYGVYTLLEDYFGCRKWDDGPAIVPVLETVSVPGDLQRKEEPVLDYRESFYPAAMDNEYMDWHKLHRFEDLWGLWGHSYFKLVPPQTYFQDHPEYFALVGGRRQATQLCLTNPAVEHIAVNYLKEAIDENPDARYWSIAPMDGAGFCTCDQCRPIDEEEGGHQGTLIRFVNKIAKQFPDKDFTTLAYTYTADPPRKTKPEDNVYIMLSSIDALRQKPLADEPTAAPFRDQLSGWKAIGANMLVWDYTTQFTNYLAPFPDYSNLQPNVAYLVDEGVKGIFAQGLGYTYGDMAELKSYLLSKSLWDPHVDSETLQTDFLTHYYGAAGTFIGQYIQALDEAVKETNAALDIYGNPVNNRKDYLSPERIDLYSRFLDQAEGAVETDALRSERVARVRLGLEYTVLQQARLYGRDQYGFLVEDESGGGLVVKPGWTDRISRFVRAAEQANVTELSEGGITPQVYGEEWKELLSNAWIPGLSVDKMVTLLYPYVPDYPAKREATLTDGMIGGTDYSYNWLLFEKVNMVATIDLSQSTNVKEVLLNYLDDPRHYIIAPMEIQVALSEDGKTFKDVGTVKSSGTTADMATGAIRRTARIPVSSGKARFVRVTAQCPQAFPSWFTGSPKRKPIIAVDEVTVR